MMIFRIIKSFRDHGIGGQFLGLCVALTISMKMKSFNLCFNIALNLLLFAGSGSSEIYFKGGVPFVKLGDRGILSGASKCSRQGRQYSSFSGISYGKAERFAEPQLNNDTWVGVKEAVKPGAKCPQCNLMGDGTAEQTEDCLFLNIHVPMNNVQDKKKRYPVMMWIHGGAFAFGEGHAYGPRFFMDEEILLVTINYRLGVLGFLSTEDDVLPGNYGLKDQVTALRWMQQNINFFNGDPDKITIFGESAGGASVHYLTLSPMAEGLFHRAIVQSGSSLSPWAHEANPRLNAVKLAVELKCLTDQSEPTSISSEEMFTCFKGKSVRELNEAAFWLRESWPSEMFGSFSPTTEPEATSSSKHTPFLTKSPWTIVFDKTANNSLSKVPMIFGNVPYEGLYMFALAVIKSPELLNELNAEFDNVVPTTLLMFSQLSSPKKIKQVTDKIREFYFRGRNLTEDDARCIIDLYSDRYIAHSVYATAVETASKGKTNNPVYLYQFNYPNPNSLVALVSGIRDSKYSKMTGHTDELNFQFDMEDMFPGLNLFPSLNHSEEEFSKNFVRLWTSFAEHGVPKYTWNDAGGTWSPISKEQVNGSGPLKFFRIEDTPKVVKVPDEIKERMAFWTKLWEDRQLVDS